MLAGSAEPEICNLLSGADDGASESVTISRPADDAPCAEQSRTTPHATIHPSTTAGCRVGSTAVN
jgi:hypothetical protein